MAGRITMPELFLPAWLAAKRRGGKRPYVRRTPSSPADLERLTKAQARRQRRALARMAQGVPIIGGGA